MTMSSWNCISEAICSFEITESNYYILSAKDALGEWVYCHCHSKFHFDHHCNTTDIANASPGAIMLLQMIILLKEVTMILSKKYQ